jgi:hypothetical protein
MLQQQEKGMIDTLAHTNATLTAQISALTEQVRRLTTTPAPTMPPNAHVPGPTPWAQQGHGRGCGTGR